MNQDVVKNATTEGVKLLEGVKVMTLNSLLQSCTVSYIDIVLISYYEPNYRQIDIEIRNRKDFHDFIDKYGDSIVFDWTIESVDGIPYMIFDLENLVEKVRPSTKRELEKIIEETIKKEGYNCDLNFIDVSKITDMHSLFNPSQFNGDISKWDVSNVENMSLMFYNSKFNGDISKWNVSNVKDMSGMFANSKFNRDISKWNVSKVEDMNCMFFESQFNKDISKWDVSNVKLMYSMFWGSMFNGDISKWDVSTVKDMEIMFDNCPLEENPPEWYKF